MLVFDFGKKLRRSLRLANPRLSFLQRTYEGECSLLVECPWRIDGPKGVVLACFDLVGRPDHEARGAAVAARSNPARDELSVLLGRRVETVRAQAPGYDLSIGFSGGYALRCLTAELDPMRARGNWTLWTPEGVVALGPGARLEQHTADEARRRFEADRKKSSGTHEDPVREAWEAMMRGRGPGAEEDT